jgi:NADH-quinone oxidoreductase subunit D
MAEIRNYTMNFGPQHPAAHGVLRLVLELDGEVVERADPHIGLLHRGTEKLAETRTWVQSVPYMDRLDYVSMMCNEHAYCMAIEKLLGVEVPLRAQYIRVMFDEITRILNHLLWLGTHALDVGAMTVVLYAFREREDLMDVLRGGVRRAHARGVLPAGRCLSRPAGPHAAVRESSKFKNATRRSSELNANRQGSLLDFIEDFTNASRLRRRIRDAADRQPHLEAAHGRHRRGVARACQGAGLHRRRCCAVRASWDLRKKQPYEVYDRMDFDIRSA